MDIEKNLLIRKSINDTPKSTSQHKIRCEVIFWSILLILCVSATNISLPLFVKELENVQNSNGNNNSYFILFFSALIFMLTFNIISQFENSQFKTTRRVHVHMFLIGLFNVLSDIFVVISCGENRTPVNIQGILSQSNFIFTFLFSYFIKRERLLKKQNIGVIFVVVGVCISLLPMMFQKSTLTVVNLFWSSIFILGYMMASLSIVYSDYSFKEHDMSVFKQLQLSCNYQFGIYVLVLPVYLISTGHAQGSIENFGTIFVHFFTTGVGIVGSLYILFYIGVYISLSATLKLITANYSKLVESLVCVVTVTFWIVFPHLNDRRVGALEICLDYLAGVVIICGIVVYVRLSK